MKKWVYERDGRLWNVERGKTQKLFYIYFMMHTYWYKMICVQQQSIQGTLQTWDTVTKKAVKVSPINRDMQYLDEYKFTNVVE